MISFDSELKELITRWKDQGMTDEDLISGLMDAIEELEDEE